MSQRQQKPAAHWWRTPFNALLTVPATLALGVAALAICAVVAERLFGTPVWLMSLDENASTAILSVVATGAMTALALAYSLTLVVFTLAASSVGPRLLKRFTTERVNQVTAGLLGGTFLYALIALGLSGSMLPRLATLGAGLLSLASVVQLIWFVRSVAQSVSVDDEMANIAARLEDDLQRLLDNQQGDEPLPDAREFETAARTSRAGYLARFDRPALLRIATSANVVLRIEHMPGEYLLKDTDVIGVNREIDDRTRDLLAGTVKQEPARSDAGTVHFSMNLLIEIALRALSPGVNDTFTALAACDMLSGAIAGIANTEPRPEVLFDKDDVARVILPGASVRQLIDLGFHPLRRAARDNILMAEGLARAYQRLFEVGSAQTRQHLAEHARVLVSDLRRAGHDRADIEAVTAHMPAFDRARLRDDSVREAK